MFKILVIMSLSLAAIAANLNVQKSEIIAHTEVFGDNEINPSTRNVKAQLNIDKELESIKGRIYFETISLISQKEDRDKHMYELLNIEKYKTISFDITNIIKNETNYTINGFLTLNGLKKDISIKSNIEEQDNQILLSGNFSFNLTDFKLEPPTMFFLTVRDQIDINYNIKLNKAK
ncbi:YceI family protein [Arcobacter sp. s6]|jgi:polyisoprenoid-binding protein YceI|uniref:YceI family protein n=1 Tax=Arcobacter sp. s6 TaxID=3230363 RepID=UPI0034A08266